MRTIKKLSLHPLGILLFIFMFVVLAAAHSLILLRLGYQPWEGLDRAEQGLAFDLATAAGFALFGLLQLRWLPLPWIRRLVVGEVLLFGLFLFVDFIYFTQFRTHIPFSTVEYLGPNHGFAATLLNAMFTGGFLLLVVVPSLLWLGGAHVLVLWRPDWFGQKMEVVDLIFWSVLILFLGGLPLLGGSMNLNPPLTSNGPVYFFWSYDFEDEVHPEDLLKDIKNVGASLSGIPIKLSEEFPLMRVKPAVGCLRNTDVATELCRAQRPNILFVFLKSLRSHELGTSGSELGLTPRFDRLVKQGIYFSRFYANGVGSRHAVVASLCSMMPNQGAPALKIYQDREMFCLPQWLETQGYTRTVVSGSSENEGPLWAKIGFDQVIDRTEFDRIPTNSGIGITDKMIYGKLLEHLAKVKQPFFASVFSQTNQYPFEVPPDYKIYGSKDKRHQYLEAVRYTDDQLYRLIQLAKTQAWWDNTLIFVFGETGNNQAPVQTPKDSLGWVSLYSKVPLLILGGPVHRRIEVRSTHDQLDLAPTVADLLGVRYTAPFAGTSVLSPRRQVALSVRPGNYHAAWNNHGAVVSEKGGGFHRQKGMDPKEVEALAFLSNSWVRLQAWLLQQNRIWPKEAP